jgi:deoxycytidylate deaminase
MKGKRGSGSKGPFITQFESKEDLLSFGYMRLARIQSLRSNYRQRIGAVLANKKPISIGYNKDTTHTKVNRVDNVITTLHAEVDCLLNMPYYLTHNGILYVYRELKSGDVGPSKPCETCMRFITLAGIKQVYYTLPNNQIGKLVV